MKKGIRLFLALLLCISIVGCGSQDNGKTKQGKKDDDSELKTNEKIRKSLEKNGFEILSSQDEQGEMDVFAKNHDNGEVLSIYGSAIELGLFYQFNESIISVESKKVINGSGDAKELFKAYEKTLKKINLSEKEVLNFLKNEKKILEKKEEENLSAHKYYKPGVYEVGKDINEGEYLVVAENDIYKSKIEVASTPYDASDTEVYCIESSFKSAYVRVKLGQFLKVEKANIYSLDDRPKLNIQTNGCFKVGVDIEPGIYNLHPQNEMSYYAINTLNEDGSYNLETNEYGFSNDIQIKINDGEYLELSYITISKTQ